MPQKNNAGTALSLFALRILGRPALALALAAVAVPATRAASDPPAAALGASSGHAGTHAVADAAWPRLQPARPADPQLEARIRAIVDGMTLRQKVGQMTQPEIRSITPEEVRRYYIGSVLNGGGSWPRQDKHASAADWLTLAERYHDASMSTDMKVAIPVIWGTDAVHGHGNVVGATLFPHNIGLGASHDPALVGEVGAAVARAVRATGIDWAFAPTVAVAQDERWGRFYESYSHDPAEVRRLAAAFVRGIQEPPSGEGVVATAKHYIGDGGTDLGRNEGIYRGGVDGLVKVHAMGYYGAIEAGVQTVMASFNSWNDVQAGIDHGKMHGSRELLTDVLKGRLGFDGFVVSDWNGIAQVPGCSDASCAAAINAGVDMIMVPDQWKDFIENTVAQVERGEIPVARIDDAVTRILRVKIRAGLFDHRPQDAAGAGTQEALQDRDLARRAVRASLVLLKNNRMGKAEALPIAAGKRVLVVGKGADSVPLQSGGWSITWQGTENVNADYPAGETILSGLRAALGPARVLWREDPTRLGADFDWNSVDTVVAVLAENPYAESNGDIAPTSSLHHASRYPEDLAALRAVAGHGRPVVTVLLSGRPLYVNDLLNLSDAFVAAWLPGTEGGGIADVLVGDDSGRPRFGFTGSLSFPWPRTACPGQGKVDTPSLSAALPIAYGLGYEKRHANLPTLPVSVPDNGCVGGRATYPLFRQSAAQPWTLAVSAGGVRALLPADPNIELSFPEDAPAIHVSTVQMRTQQDAKRLSWSGKARWLVSASAPQDLRRWYRDDGAIAFDLRVMSPPRGRVRVATGCGGDCWSSLDITDVIARLPPERATTLKIPLACLRQEGFDPAHVTEAVALESTGPFEADITDVRIEARASRDAEVIDCAH